MDFPQNMSMEEAFALAEAEAKLAAALKESEERFFKAEIPNRLNEDWRFGRPHKYAKELAELLQSDTPGTGTAEVQGCDEEAVRISTDDDDLRQTEMLMPTIGSDALLGLHLQRFGNGYANRCLFLLAKNEILTLYELCYARLQRDVPDRLRGRKQGGLRSGSRPRTQLSLGEGSAIG